MDNRTTCLTCRPWAAGVTSRCPACGRPPRSGSYPLMNLAEDFGVDYGDVLLAADWFRRNHAMEPLTLDRDRESASAWSRMYFLLRAAGRDSEYFQLRDCLSAHARHRWGRR